MSDSKKVKRIRFLATIFQAPVHLRAFSRREISMSDSHQCRPPDIFADHPGIQHMARIGTNCQMLSFHFDSAGTTPLRTWLYFSRPGIGRTHPDFRLLAVEDTA